MGFVGFRWVLFGFCRILLEFLSFIRFNRIVIDFVKFLLDFIRFKWIFRILFYLIGFNWVYSYEVGFELNLADLIGLCWIV